MGIPHSSKEQKGGGVRIYFFLRKIDEGRIICADAEFKKRVEASAQKIRSASMRYKQTLIEGSEPNNVRGGERHGG